MFAYVEVLSPDRFRSSIHIANTSTRHVEFRLVLSNAHCGVIEIALMPLPNLKGNEVDPPEPTGNNGELEIWRKKRAIRPLHCRTAWFSIVIAFAVG
jgi:hypothetical protein